MERKPPDTSLIAGLAAGDAHAFAGLYDRLARPLLRMAAAMLNDRTEAEDAVQDLFVSLVRSRERFRKIDDLDGYVFAGLRNGIRTRLARRQSERHRLDRLPLPVSVDPEPAAHEDVTKALATLPSDQREVVALKIDAGLTFKQIAEVLEISPNTAASRYRYAIDKLRQSLGSAQKVNND